MATIIFNVISMKVGNQSAPYLLHCLAQQGDNATRIKYLSPFWVNIPEPVNTEQLNAEIKKLINDLSVTECPSLENDDDLMPGFT